MTVFGGFDSHPRHSPKKGQKTRSCGGASTPWNPGRSAKARNEKKQQRRNKMKTKRKSKWEKKLTLTEIKHLREMTDGTLRSAKATFKFQKEKRDRSPRWEPCWDCRRIAEKLNEPI